MGIAAPLMKSDLGLSEKAYGIAFSAFFWIYAPVQFFAFGLATLLWLLPWQQTVRVLPTTGHHDDGARVPVGALLSKWPLWSMSIGHALGNYCFYFLLAWLPLFLTKSRGFSIGEMTMLAPLGYAVQGVCALGYGHFSDWWPRSGRSEALCRRWVMVA